MKRTASDILREMEYEGHKLEVYSIDSVSAHGYTTWVDGDYHPETDGDSIGASMNAAMRLVDKMGRQAQQSGGRIDPDFGWTTTGVAPGGVQYVCGTDSQGRSCCGVWSAADNDYRLFDTAEEAIEWGLKEKRMGKQAQQVLNVGDEMVNEMGERAVVKSVEGGTVTLEGDCFTINDGATTQAYPISGLEQLGDPAHGENPGDRYWKKSASKRAQEDVLRKQTVHNLNEVKALIKEAFARGDEWRYEGTEWFSHDGEKLCKSIIHAIEAELVMPDMSSTTFEIDARVAQADAPADLKALVEDAASSSRGFIEVLQDGAGVVATFMSADEASKFAGGLARHLAINHDVHVDVMQELAQVRVGGDLARQASKKIAVDQETRNYFTTYYTMYGAQLTRDLAMKRRARKLAQYSGPDGYGNLINEHGTWTLDDPDYPLKSAPLVVVDQNIASELAQVGRVEGIPYKAVPFGKAVLLDTNVVGEKKAQKVAASAGLVFVKDVAEFGIHSGDKFSVVPSSDPSQVLLYGDMFNQSGMDAVPMPAAKLKEFEDMGFTLDASKVAQDGRHCDRCQATLSEDDFSAPGSWSYKCPSCGYRYSHSGSQARRAQSGGWSIDEDGCHNKDYPDGWSGLVLDNAEGGYDWWVLIHSDSEEVVKPNGSSPSLDEAKAAADAHHDFKSYLQARQAQVIEVPNQWSQIADNIWECDYETGAHGAVECEPEPSGQGSVFKMTFIGPDGTQVEEDHYELQDAQAEADKLSGPSAGLTAKVATKRLRAVQDEDRLKALIAERSAKGEKAAQEEIPDGDCQHDEHENGYCIDCGATVNWMDRVFQGKLSVDPELVRIARRSMLLGHKIARITKCAVDAETISYWSDYYAQYGTQFTRSIPKMVKMAGQEKPVHFGSLTAKLEPSITASAGQLEAALRQACPTATHIVAREQDAGMTLHASFESAEPLTKESALTLGNEVARGMAKLDLPCRVAVQHTADTQYASGLIQDQVHTSPMPILVAHFGAARARLAILCAKKQAEGLKFSARHRFLAKIAQAMIESEDTLRFEGEANSENGSWADCGEGIRAQVKYLGAKLPKAFQWIVTNGDDVLDQGDAEFAAEAEGEIQASLPDARASLHEKEAAVRRAIVDEVGPIASITRLAHLDGMTEYKVETKKASIVWLTVRNGKVEDKVGEV